MRDYLNSHPDTAAEYAALKKKLAAEFPFDNDGYCDGKEKYIEVIGEKGRLFPTVSQRLVYNASHNILCHLSGT